MWKTHECSLLDSGDVVYRHILQLRRPRYAFIAGSEMAKDIGLDPVEWAMCSLPSHGRMLSGRSRWLVAGSFWFKTRLLLVDLLSGRCLPCCKASSISLVDSALSLPCLHCASSVGLAEAPSFLATAALLRPRLPAQERGTAVSILTPLNTSQRLSSRRLWAG